MYSEEVITYINTTEPYIAINLDINLGEVTTLTWDHLGSCVDYYNIILNDETVVEHRVPLGSSHVVVHLTSLETCVGYTLKVVPVLSNSEEWEGEVVVQEEFKRLDDKNCVIQKVTRRESEESSVKSALPRVSSSSHSGSTAMVSRTLLCAIVTIIARWL